MHAAQCRREGWMFRWKYWCNKWKYERPAYYAQICFLIESGETQNHFAWLRDILDINYGQSKEDVEDLLDEIYV